MKYKIEDVVLVYKDTPTFEEGTIAQVIDHDPNDDSYAIADLRDVGRADQDIMKILNLYVKWVKPENMKLLTFNKPKKPSKLAIAAPLLVMLHLGIGLGIALYHIYG